MARFVSDDQSILTNNQAVSELMALVKNTADPRLARVKRKIITPTGDVIYHFQFGDGDLHELLVADPHIGTEKLCRTVAAVMAGQRCAAPEPHKTLDVFIADSYLARLDEEVLDIPLAHLREPDPTRTPDWCHPSPRFSGDTPWAVFFGEQLDEIEREGGVVVLVIIGHNREYGHSFLRADGPSEKVQAVSDAVESIPSAMRQLGLRCVTRFDDRPTDSPFLNQHRGTLATFEMDTELAFRKHMNARLGATCIEAVWKRFRGAVGLIIEQSMNVPKESLLTEGGMQMRLEKTHDYQQVITERHRLLTAGFEKIAHRFPTDDPFMQMVGRRHEVHRWGQYLENFKPGKQLSPYEIAVRSLASIAYRARDLVPMFQVLRRHEARLSSEERDGLYFSFHHAVTGCIIYGSVGLFQPVDPAEAVRTYLVGCNLASQIVLDNRLPDPSWVRALDMSRTTGSLSA